MNECKPSPRGLLLLQREKREKEVVEKTSGCRRCESHYHATIGVKID